jgi:hypothetical protein
MVFPDGQDGDADVFALIGKKDEMEAFIQEVMGYIDFFLYRQLWGFLGADEGLAPLSAKIAKVQAVFRSFTTRDRLIQVKPSS